MDALRDFGYLDWQFSALVCKTLWNYSDKMTSSLSCFGAEETELLLEQLEVYLGEELRMCVTLSACVCVCVRMCVCVCCVCVYSIVHRYTLLSVCSSCPADEELAVESVPEGVPEETRVFLHDMWRSEFCPVAKPLLERVKTNCSDLIPL